MNAAFDLQRALRRRLVADGRVTALLEQRIYDGVPQGSILPYVAFGDIETRDFGTQTQGFHEHTVPLHVWSAEAGRRETLDIIDSIDAALQDGILPLIANRAVNVRTTFWTVVQDIENELYHGVMRLRIVTEPLGETP